MHPGQMTAGKLINKQDLGVMMNEIVWQRWLISGWCDMPKISRLLFWHA